LNHRKRTRLAALNGVSPPAPSVTFRRFIRVF
jgi:hypothetical protein